VEARSPRPGQRGAARLRVDHLAAAEEDGALAAPGYRQHPGALLVGELAQPGRDQVRVSVHCPPWPDRVGELAHPGTPGDLAHAGKPAQRSRIERCAIARLVRCRSATTSSRIRGSVSPLTGRTMKKLSLKVIITSSRISPVASFPFSREMPSAGEVQQKCIKDIPRLW